MKKIDIKVDKINNYKVIKVSNVPTQNLSNNKKPNFWLLVCIGLVIGFINGFWGGGGGMVAVPTLSNIIKLPDKKSHATAILIMLPLCIVSFVVYLIGGVVEWNLTYKVTIGFVVGGIVGALILKNINNIVLGFVFSLVIIAGGIKMLI